MSKFTEIGTDTQELFDKVLENTNIPDYITFKLLQSEKEKNPMKILKANDIISHLTLVEIIVVVNESLLDLLGEPIVEVLFDELIAGVHFNTELDKLTIEKPDFVSYTTIMKKYGDKLTNAKATVVALLQQKEDEAREAKQAKMDKKKK